MQSNLSEDLNLVTERIVILLDGRQINAKLFCTYELENHDQLKVNLKFGIFSKKSKVHHALSNIIADLLSTHSIDFRHKSKNVQFI